MKIKEKILLEIKHEGVTYLVPIDAKQDIIIEEDNAWEADVDYMSSDDNAHDSENPIPILYDMGRCRRTRCSYIKWNACPYQL